MNQSVMIALLYLFRIASWVVGGLVVGVLACSNTTMVKAGQYLNVFDVYLVMQPDCELILYTNFQPVPTTNIRVSGPSNKRNCSFNLQIELKKPCRLQLLEYECTCLDQCKLVLKDV